MFLVLPWSAYAAIGCSALHTVSSKKRCEPRTPHKAPMDPGRDRPQPQFAAGNAR